MKFLGKLIVGVLASIGFFIVVLSGLGIYALMRVENLGPATPKAPAKMALHIDLDKGFVEGSSGRRLEGFSLRSRTTLQDAIIAIRRAKDDPRVTGIVANMTEQSLGLAQVQDVRDVITEFKASGKPVMLYSETIGEGTGALPSYYLAASFGDLWVQPSGTVGVAGIGIEQPFFKTFLDRFGVKANVIQRKEYKSAMENLTNERISPANKEALQ
ncbi:MAG: S49 family peptidase, partial [Rhodospirillaceae bacterium]|nr:S49 family peptidase [Rhodospirillaceae bacterium]